jgi:hypothetical protein
MFAMFVTELVSQPEMFLLNADAPLMSKNMYPMFVTELVFQPEMSALKADASRNMSCMFVTELVSHDGISLHPATPHRAVVGSPQFAS